MKKITLILLLTLTFGCKNGDYTIAKGKVGKINSETIIKNLDSIFVLDSISRRIGEGDYMFSGNDNYLIFDKQNDHLLTLTPKQQHDINEKIETIEIISNKYSTENGLRVDGTFEDIQNTHNISAIQNTINNIIVFVDEIDAYFIIDKNNLPIDLRLGTNNKIEEINIPPNSKIKKFMIGWY